MELSCFFDDPRDVGNLISGSSAFSKTNLNIWKFMVHVLLKPGLENFDLYFASMSAIVRYFEHSLALPFFVIGMKTDLFQSWGHCWVFQICWHIDCSTFTASSFRIWNSSAGIASPPLTLFVVMLPKAHLTSHSRMSGSRWVITPSWLSGSWRSFLPHYHWAFTHFKGFVLWLLQNGQRYVSPTSNQTNSTILFQYYSIWPSGDLVLSRNAGPFQLLVGEHLWKMGSEAACLKCCHQISIASVLIPGERQITPREALIMLVFISCICTNVWMNDWMTEQVCLRED